MKAELVPENGDPPIPIVKDLTVVGRRDFCDVLVDDASLSKRHCVLVKTDGLLVIRDLASTNGTKVKGQRVRWAALLPDDRVTLGSYKLRVYLGPDDVPSPSERREARARPEDAPAPKVAAKSPAPVPAPPAWAAGEDRTRLAPPEPEEGRPSLASGPSKLDAMTDEAWRRLLTGAREEQDFVIDLD